MRSLLKAINAINGFMGRTVSWLTLAITALVFMEVFLRYIFNAPTTWSYEVNNYLQCALVMLAGGYTLMHGGHVRVDILYRFYDARKKAWVEILTAVLVITPALPILYFGGELAWEALVTGQRSVSAAELLLWPSMATVPVGVTLLLVQALANAAAAGIFLATGRETLEG
jgi:TRAP-type mannitol/chloroaromatic compound transport system permease small subunit